MEVIEEIISCYKDYLIKHSDVSINKEESVSIIDIIKLERQSKRQFSILEDLSSKYKLYDENYREFMICMGKVAMEIKKIDEVEADNKLKNRIIKEFLDLHNLFESLQQTNIMKDVYVWKFVN